MTDIYPLTSEQLYGVAIHEAGHLVVRYLLFGNIDTVESVSVGFDGDSFGRNSENSGQKSKEFEDALDSVDVFCRVGGYAFNECCYSLAGVITDKVHAHMDTVPFENSDEDMFSLYSHLGMYLDSDEIDSLVKKALPTTEKIVNDNFGLITKVANALVAAPDHQLDNKALQDLLTR